MKQHRKEQHIDGNPVFQCTVCSKTCKRKRDVRYHMTKFHSSDDAMICSRCDQRFTDKASLKVHKRSHRGEKLNRCGLCQYACSTPKRLGEHMLIHANTKPFGCDECEESFRTKLILKRHQNLHHNPSYIAPTRLHKCKECNRSFARKGNLVKHQANHTPKFVRAQVPFKGKIIVYEDKQSEAILEKSEFLKSKVKFSNAIKTKLCPGCLAEKGGACKSCQGAVRFRGRRTLRQRFKGRKCQDRNFRSEDQEACPVVNLEERKQISSEIPGSMWEGFFQQVKKLSVDNEENPENVKRGFQYKKPLKVDKSPDNREEEGDHSSKNIKDASMTGLF
jgi:hypothetical protein